MIIGIDARTLQDKQYSGVSEYTYQLLSEIFRLDTHNQYRLFFNSSHDLSDVIPRFDFPNVTIEKFDYPNKLLNYGLLLPFSKPWLDDLLGGVDLFFAPHLNFISVSRGTKFVLTVHDLSFIRYPEFFSRRKNIWHACLGVRRLARRADVIIAVSENTKSDVVELLKVAPEKVHVVYSGIDDEIGRVDDENKLKFIKSKYNLPDNYILYLGTIEPRKNLISLIESFEMVKQLGGHDDLQLVLAGGDGWKNQDLHDYVAKSAYSSSIKFLGYIDRGEKSSLYTMARALVYPSFYEGFGFPPLEAMKCGLPVMTSYSSSLPEIVSHLAVLVNPYDLNDIKNGLLAVLKKKHTAEIKTPTWREAALKYLEIFERLVN